MKIVQIKDIVIPADRYATDREFDVEHLNDLCEDIALNGLQHPPVVRTVEGSLVLVSGECRLRVIRDLATAGVAITHGTIKVPLDSIPVTDFGDLPPRQAKILELHENLKRKNPSWQDTAKAEAELHAIRSEEAAEVGAKQTYLATAEELAGRPLSGSTEQAYATTSIRQSVVVAPHLADPDVAAAKTVKEAIKIVAKKEEVKHLEKLAAFLGTTQTAERHTLHKGKAEEELVKLPDASFDCILTDPPYGIDADKFGSQSFYDRHYKDSVEEWTERIVALSVEGFRVAKEKAHAYCFCDPRLFMFLHQVFKDAGWRVFPTPLIWVKSGGMLPLPEHGPRRCYETILYAIKGDRKTTGIFSDVITCSVEKTTIHPDQKPVDLYVDLLRRSVRPGETVLDPFCGSGTIFVAANRLQLTATGIDKEDTSFALSTQRLKER